MTLRGEPLPGADKRLCPMGVGDLFITFVGSYDDTIDFIVTQCVEEVILQDQEDTVVISSIVCVVNYKYILN